LKDDKSTTRKNRPLPENERPDWAKSIPDEEWESYVHSPQCRVCNANHNGRNLRCEIEALVIERKTHVEVCNVINERYGLRLAPHNVSRHMARHAPGYINVLDALMQSELGDVLNGTVGPIIDQTKFLLGVMQVGWQQLLEHPEQVSVVDGMRAACQLAKMGIDVGSDNRITQKEINDLILIMQTVMNPGQREEVHRRYDLFRDAERESESSPQVQGQATTIADDENGVVVDGEYVALDDLTFLPDEDPEDDDK
jgi:hypothetical protein